MVGILFAFWQEGSDKQFFRSPDFKALKADLVLHGVSYRRDTRKRSSEWVVKADTARFYEKKRECEFDRVRIVFLPGDKEPVTIVARKGLYDFDHGRLRVSGDVKVDGFRDYVLYADQLLYDPDSMTITAPGNAELVGSAGNRLKGKAMVYYIRDRRLTLAFPRAEISENDSGLN
ncbi:MAG: LPS export ABC transporter periplasmic protein LptC [Thermodesulfatator sp.]|nr:MAG: LPS export ABC transporter periplasmic protein LptC [Thermodesulfatator sp.]